MGWFKENISVLTLVGFIISLCVYIYQDDRGKNKEEHQQLEVKVDKIIEKMEADQSQKFDRYEEIISENQRKIDSLTKRK